MRRRCKPKSVEIGYIESFDHGADVYVLKTGDTRREVAILGPVFDGDTIEVKHDFATITLRLVGQTGPVVISKANDCRDDHRAGSTEGLPVRRVRLDDLGCAALRPGTARASLGLDPRQH